MKFKEWLVTNDIDVKIDNFWWYMPHTMYSHGCVVVVIDVKKFDSLWKRDKSNYIPPHGTKNTIGDRYANHAQNLKGSTGYDMPIVSCTIEDYFTKKPIDPPLVSIRDGRHRFAVFRDNGFAKIAVGIVSEKAKALDKACGANI